MTLPAWALKIGADAAAAIIEVSETHPDPEFIIDFASIIAAEVARFHAAQESEQLLAAVAAVAALCAETEDGRLVTKEAVSPVDFMGRIKAVVNAAADSITWRIAFVERLADLEARRVDDRHLLTRVWRLIEVWPTLGEGDRASLADLADGSDDPHGWMAALHTDLKAYLARADAPGPVARLTEAVKTHRYARHRWRTHETACATCDAPCGGFVIDLNRLCPDGRALLSACVLDSLDAALEHLDSSFVVLRR